MFGKSATSITDYLISEESFNSEYCVSLLQHSLKKKSDSVLKSIEGYSITDEQKFRMRIVRSHLDYITNAISQVDSSIDTMVEKHEGLISLLCTIPGVDRNYAITIISEIGTDISQFSFSKRLCCWAGLTPDNNESADKKSLFALHVPEYISNLQMSHHCHRTDDSHCCFQNDVYRRGLESY